MLETFLEFIIPPLFSFLLGLVIKSPLYQNTRKFVDEVVKATEDNKLTKDEWKRIVEAGRKVFGN